VREDFDFVVLAVGLGAVPYVARELVERSSRWEKMVHHCKTAATQAFQIWMKEDMETLGWRHGQVNISGYVEPFDTWAFGFRGTSSEAHSLFLGLVHK
jgi:hypothetical protein